MAAPLNRVRTAFTGDSNRARLLIALAAALGLWAFAAVRFSRPPPNSGHPNRAHVFRLDVNDIEAYPPGFLSLT